MSKSRSIICLFAALALGAGGCGESTKTASTSPGTSTPAATSTQANESSHTASQGASAPAAPPANKASQPKATEKAARAKPHPEAPHKGAEAAKPSGEAGAPQLKVPPQKLFANRAQRTFIAACEAAKGSHSSCECVLARQEISNVEKGQSVAETLALEAAMQRPGASLEALRLHHVLLPRGVKHSLELCKVTNK